MNKDLEKEILELEKEVFSTPESKAKIEEPTEPKVQDGPGEPAIADPQPNDQWEKRFKNYKASTDLTIRDLRSELASVKERIATLQGENLHLKTQLRSTESLPSIFNEEETDILGEPAVNALNKGINEIIERKVKPLEEELNRSKKELADRDAKQAKQAAFQNYTAFLDALGKVVKDYKEINVSPGFLEYMKGVDDVSGSPREYLFRKAEEALDVRRVASFFIDYKSTIKQPLQNEITPTGSTVSPSESVVKEQDVPVVTMDFVNKFYDDLARGKYKTKEGRSKAAEIESIIEKALMEGRVK